MPRSSSGLVALCAATAFCAAALAACAPRAVPTGTSSALVTPSPSAMPDHRVADIALSAPLDRREVVAAVLAVNPGVAAARAAWRAAAARVASRGSWEDPTLSYALAPLSIGSDMPFGQQVELSQRLPLAGKPSLQAAIAAAEADAARADIGAVRQRLALMAAQAYDDDALATASLAVVAEQRALVEQLRGAADARVASGTGSLQDPLRAEAELAELDQQAAALRADRDIAVSQLTALLHRSPSTPLPAPPDEPAALAVDAAATPLVGDRPDLARARAEARGAEAGETLARRQYLPDVSVNASYTSMWPAVEHQYMVGVSVSIPLQRDRLAAGAAEAAAQSQSARLMLEHRAIEVAAEAEQARRRVDAARERLELSERRVLPALTQRLAAARIDVESGRAGLAAALDAERDLRAARLERRQAQAELARRSAEWQLAVGLVPVLGIAISSEAP